MGFAGSCGHVRFRLLVGGGNRDAGKQWENGNAAVAASASCASIALDHGVVDRLLSRGKRLVIMLWHAYFEALML